MSEKSIVSISDEAKQFLVKSLVEQGKESVKLNLILGRDKDGKPKMKYELQAVDGPDLSIDLGEGKKFIIEGNIIPAILGTKIDLKEGLDVNGNKVTGFIFDNPNVPKPISNDCTGCPGDKGSGCSNEKCGSK